MKTKVEYQCDICKREYTDVKEAVACEARGTPKLPPVGLIFGNASEIDHRDKKPINITFAIAKVYLEGHAVDASLWACRNNGAGDSLGKELCGSSNGLYIQGIPNSRHSTFKRMVRYLKKEKIPITVWDGKDAVPLDVFFQRRRRVSTLKEMGVEV